MATLAQPPDMTPHPEADQARVAQLLKDAQARFGDALIARVWEAAFTAGSAVQAAARP